MDGHLCGFHLLATTNNSLVNTEVFFVFFFNSLGFSISRNGIAGSHDNSV